MELELCHGDLHKNLVGLLYQSIFRMLAATFSYRLLS